MTYPRRALYLRRVMSHVWCGSIHWVHRLATTALGSGLPWWLSGRESSCNAEDTGDWGSIPGSGRAPGGGHGNPLQFLAWRIPWTEEPGGLQSMGLQRVKHDWSNWARIQLGIQLQDECGLVHRRIIGTLVFLDQSLCAQQWIRWQEVSYFIPAKFVPVGAAAHSSFCKTLGNREGFGSQHFSGYRRLILGIYSMTPRRIWGPHSIVTSLFKDLAMEYGWREAANECSSWHFWSVLQQTVRLGQVGLCCQMSGEKSFVFRDCGFGNCREGIAARAFICIL